MSGNPFDDEDGIFTVLVNDEGQYCIWPGFAEVPAGWTVTHPPAARATAVAHVEAEWVDMRPRSLIASSGDRT